MKKAIILQAIILTLLIVVPPVHAESADVTKIQTFIENVIQVLVTLSGLIAAGFFVWGEALIIADQNHVEVKVVALQVVASEKEHPLLTTDPREIYI